jgi:hypothetical protein
MVTYRKDLAKKHWHRPWPVRVGLALLGLVLLLAGLVGWELEDVYGGDPDRQEYVIGDEPGRAVVLGDDGEVVYESTDIADAEAYVQGERGSRDYAVPILLIAGGVLAIIAAVAPSPVRHEPEPTTPPSAGVGV